MADLRPEQIDLTLGLGNYRAAIFAALAMVIGIIDPDRIDPWEGPISPSKERSR